ncbi:hypothetical protein PTSG_12831 [Salpingoeca rosetta]|uniref:Peptidase S54 rhomboid domain-containing protein n=1 Tax=Salpingoeca rosetta (strain ATCC 50818 / BSB-021) TaxID=946362 RepID=F2UM34_SALR5|nr:uncharacterized protein PTSG_12831 [Salpingoeca rosetta]EGD78183.1 hypothetical protein PTSG_12831 [Salpingoeca rosetta]|eukprot:XP_004989859.1 hypothetical protein PTSG_12831 [Salpingoeca rosetta]
MGGGALRSTASSLMRRIGRMAHSTRRGSPPTEPPRYSHTAGTNKKPRIPLGRVLFKPLIGGTAITGAAFVAAAYYEQNWSIFDHMINKIKADPIATFISHGGRVSAKEAFLAFRYGVIKPWELDIYVFLAMSSLVILLRKRPRFHSFIRRNFEHRPASGVIRTMFTSALSHSTMMHALLNTWALVLIVPSVYLNGSPSEFWAFCSGAAMFSSLGSVVQMLLTRRAILGVGASGVIMALLAMSTFLNAQFDRALIRFPFFDLTSAQLLIAVMALDVAVAVMCVSRGWRLRSHAKRLFGALFGGFYFFKGQHLQEDLRSHFRLTSMLKKP